MKSILPNPIRLLSFIFNLYLIISSASNLIAQRVDNSGCPESYFRNNGNGQSVSTFASNINPSSIYYQSALSSGSQGNFTFKWNSAVTNPPVIYGTAITSTSGVFSPNWSFGNNSTGSPFNPPGVPNGGEVKYTFYNNNLPTAGVITVDFIDPFDGSYVNTCSYELSSGSSSSGSLITDFGVSSGGSGGLESKSLGTAVAERMFTKSIQNISSEVDYQQLPVFSSKNLELRSKNFTISDYMPDQAVLGKGYIRYITSPKDLVSFTNAKEVVSIDYVKGGQNKAVAFCTKTYDEIYSHTKPVCDRLKGSELLAIDTIGLESFTFLQYTLKPENGLIEHAVSFSVGFDASDLQYTLQSEWTTDRYLSLEQMLNFQLWSAEPALLQSMLKDILQKLRQDMPIKQRGSVSQPTTYITKAERNPYNQLELVLNINNHTSATQGLIKIKSKENEQSSNTITQSFPVKFNAHTSSTINIPVKDMAESEILLEVDKKQQDFIYVNDGIWNIFKTTSSDIKEFIIYNDTFTAKPTEFRLFRNVRLNGATSDHITVYRMVKGGGVATDLSAYNALRFSANGTGQVRIRLLKKSIKDFNKQYEFVLPLKRKNTDYEIPVASFIAPGTDTPITMDDVYILSFSYEAAAGSSQINTILSNVRFGQMTSNLLALVKPIKVFPNPATTQINLLLKSQLNEKMNLNIIHMTTGQTVEQRLLDVTKGENQLKLFITETLAPGTYLMQMQSATQQFIGKVMVE